MGGLCVIREVVGRQEIYSFYLITRLAITPNNLLSGGESCRVYWCNRARRTLNDAGGNLTAVTRSHVSSHESAILMPGR
jgi:hypothetical protein